MDCSITPVQRQYTPRKDGDAVVSSASKSGIAGVRPDRAQALNCLQPQLFPALRSVRAGTPAIPVNELNRFLEVSCTSK